MLFICLALQAWLDLMEEAVEETDPSGIKYNVEAQHRYLTWRAEKVISILVYAFFLSYISFINSSLVGNRTVRRDFVCLSCLHP